MNSKISGGVIISVDTSFQPDHSNPLENEYTFAYQITIENSNDFPIKLLRRKWFITDAKGNKREVEGEGVVGVQPVIHSGGKYQYVSGCHLKTEIGKMQGHYVLENLNSRKTFIVTIPSFLMQAHQILN